MEVGTANKRMQEIINSWQHAYRRVCEIDSDLNRAKCVESNARNALGKALVPDDAKPNEVFCIWVRDAQGVERLLKVVSLPGAEFGISWRV